MASLFQNPVDALLPGDSKPSPGPLQLAQDAKDTNPEWSYGSPARHNPNSRVLSRDKAGQDPLWYQAEIDGARWNKSYPYQLLVLKKTSGGYIRDTNFGAFTLPIPPQSTSISTPFAITTSVTLGGIVEEHNGAPLKNIAFQGTTGVMPLRPVGGTLSQANVFQGVFAGTMNGVNTVVGAARSLAGNAFDSNLVGEDEELRGTGYYQFKLLERFLESYAISKKNGGQGTKEMRLALAIWKDQAVYLVTPVSLDVQRNAQSPWEYTYNLVFRAWGRVNLNDGPKAVEPFTPISRDPNALAQALNKLNDCRRILQGSKDVITGAVADVEKLILEPMREVVFFCKDALGVALTLADLPEALARIAGQAVLESDQAIRDLTAGAQAVGREFRDMDISDAFWDTIASGLPPRASHWDIFGPGRGVHAASPASPAYKVIDNPGIHFDLFSRIKPASLNLPVDVQRRILEERRRIAQKTRLDFEKFRDQLVETTAAFADAVGAGSTTYNETFGRPATASDRTPTQDEYEVLFALNQTVLEMNRLAASGAVNGQTTTMESVAGMASASGIAFKIPVSKYAVPFPYGSTLEQLAARYLGDPNRWHEIVSLNGLRQPYVDEEGFELELLVNGSGNQVTVGDGRNLYVGQPVTVSSSYTSRTQRRITGIEIVSPGNVLLTLDGDADLERFRAGSSLHAFLPDTVNSQQLIYIPSDQDAPESDYQTKSIPGIDEFDPLIRAGGVDLLLTQSGDLAVTPDGDCRLATGLTNLIQRLRTALATPRGSLLHHPDYGLGLEVGVSTADLDAKQVLSALQGLVRSDPAFSGVTNVAISKAGPAIRVSMSVGISGTSQVIPITVDVKT